jgi:hypothetical protein
MGGGGEGVAALASTPARWRCSGQPKRTGAREGCGGLRCAREEQEERGEKGKYGDGAVPILNGHDEVGDGRRRAPHSGKEWGASAAVEQRGVASTGLEPAGAGGWRASVQNKGGGGGCQVGPQHSTGRRGLKLI